MGRGASSGSPNASKSIFLSEFSTQKTTQEAFSAPAGQFFKERIQKEIANFP